MHPTLAVLSHHGPKLVLVGTATSGSVLANGALTELYTQGCRGDGV